MKLFLKKPIYVSKQLNYPGDYYRKKNGFTVVGQDFYGNQAFIHKTWYYDSTSPYYRKVIGPLQLSGRPDQQDWISVYVASGLKSHGGLDIPCLNDTPVYAAHSGRVVEIAGEANRGEGIVIRSLEKYELPAGEFYFKALYWHLYGYKSKVKEGDLVDEGQLIGYGDTTGLSTGPHLHFETKYCDEFGNTLEKENGWRGRFDPLPFIIDWDNVENPYLIPIKDETTPQTISRLQMALNLIKELFKRIFG